MHHISCLCAPTCVLIRHSKSACDSSPLGSFSNIGALFLRNDRTDSKISNTHVLQIQKCSKNGTNTQYFFPNLTNNLKHGGMDIFERS